MIETPLHVIVLAAGEGKRMNSKRPKVLMPLAGRPLLAHVLDTAHLLEPVCIHLVHGYGAEQLRRTVSDRPGLRWVWQAERLGTAHAVSEALRDIPDTARVLVLCGDVPLIRLTTLHEILRIDAALTLLTVRLENPAGYGRVLLDEHGDVQAVVEDQDADAQQREIKLVNTGILAAMAEPLKRWVGQIHCDNRQHEYYLTDIFALAVAEQKPAVCVQSEDPAEAAGVNTPLQLADLETIYRHRAVHELMRQGVRVIDPDRLDVRGIVQTGRDVELDIDVILEGVVSLGEDVHVGPFTRLKDVTLAAGTQVLAHCDLEGVVTRGPCVIGPFSRLRPGTELAEGVRVGNFVEVKKTRMGRHSKASHLAYLGDAEVGCDVNVGAGAITCNYDGVKKSVTCIKDGAFIGSNSALVAPVTIGAQATIGAGSVITRDAPKAALTLARSRQMTVRGWSGRQDVAASLGTSDDEGKDQS